MLKTAHHTVLFETAKAKCLDSKVTDREGYLRAAKYYFDCIIGPFKSFMLDALRRVRTLQLDMICPGHGPVLDTGIDWMLDTYEEWSTVINPNPRPTVIIPYVSAYGYTGQLAESIAEGIRGTGRIDVRCYDMVTADAQQVAQELLYADGFLLGTPAIVGEALKPIWDLTTGMFAATHGGKLAGAFGSYGWSGEGVPHIMERLGQLRLRLVDPLRVRFKPSADQLQSVREYGKAFGEALLADLRPVQRAPKKKVRCTVCGAVFDEGVELCPVCQMDSTHFVPATEEEPAPAPAQAPEVRCTVCGAIFSGDKPHCPVCGVGRDKFVEVEVEDVTYHHDTRNTYVILGNGAAGVSAAEAIRERDGTGTILLISNEGPAYQRPMLTKVLFSGLEPEQIALHPQGWYESRGIVQMLHRQVEKVDTAARTVVLDGGETVPYTKLIFALGSECFIPPIPGADKEGVVAIRRLADVEKVRALTPLRRAVVIGGGVLGLEAASELRRNGCEVTVLELAPTLMGRQLDGASAGLLLERCAAFGVRVELGVQIAALEGDKAVTGVKLGSGEVIPADLVVVSCGIRANTAVAQAAGVAVERAIVVNEAMDASQQRRKVMDKFLLMLLYVQ